MIAIALLVCVFALFSQETAAYGGKYDRTKMTPNVDCSKAPAALSWHVHITYMLTNSKQIADAIAFRQKVQKYFTPFFEGNDPVCPGTPEEPSGRYGKQVFTSVNMFFFKLFFNRQRSIMYDLRSRCP
jgi:hypothetical protein